MKTQKICFFLTNFNIGGIEKVFIELANYLVKNNYSCYFIVAKDVGILKLNLEEKIRVINLNCGYYILFFKLVYILIKLKPDVVFSGNEIRNIILAFTKPFLHKTKIILSQHNYFNSESYSLINKKVTTFLMKYCYNYCDKIIAVSNGVKDFLISEISVNIKKIEVIYNPISIEMIKKMSLLQMPLDIRKPYLLYCGRLSIVKNLPLLLDAFKIIIRNDDLNLVIAGDGSQRSILEKIAKDNKINDKIFFTGALSNVYPLIKNCLCVVLPSTSESFGCIIPEAFALKKIIVSTPTKGAKELLSPCIPQCLSATFSDPKIFAESLEDSINLLRKKEIDVENLYSYVKKFDINSIGHQYISIINSFI